ncbi:TetR/AcrR family transcriptional regulator [Tomitella gaofuii]|uniref:TetR/AcrR family transcriptional regulator n=1 Tax=Tomitella gaofuii TaxID=2760083 RepID=UPI0015F79663|nr:TetR/AcrR family transcriptional regulator [Tomitella gaofuii]
MSAQVRPRDRRQRIAVVAAEAFDAHGYHGAGMDEIAAAVGISGPALYRHFPSKYALFLHSVESLVSALDDATDLPPDPAAPPRARLTALLASLAATSIAHRRSGGLYRWEARMLRDGDRRRVVRTMRTVTARLAAPVHALRPELTGAEVQMRTTAALSVLGSITGHRVPLARQRIASVLVDGCLAVVDCPARVPAAPVRAADAAPHSTAVRPAPADPREALLTESIRLFARRGYHEVGVEEIAAAAGMTASGVYRHFGGKPALLDAAFRRTAEGFGPAQHAATASAPDPAAALRLQAELYIRRSFRHPDQLTLYFAEVSNLPPSRRRMLRAAHRRLAECWADTLLRSRPDMPRNEAVYLAHAAFAVILDVGRAVHFTADPGTQAQLEEMVLALQRAG